MFTVNEISNSNDDIRKRILNDGSMSMNQELFDEKELQNTLNELRETHKIQIPINCGVTGQVVQNQKIFFANNVQVVSKY